MTGPVEKARPTAPTAIGQQLLDQYGNKQGLVDGALPIVVFVVLNLVTKDARLSAAVGAGVAALVVVLRLVRKESVQQAFGGLVGLGVGFVVALRTGHAKDVYGPGILVTLAYAVVPLLTVLVARPAAGYVAALMDTRWATWRQIPALRRAATLATLVWVLGFGLKFAVQGTFYLNDWPTALGIGRLVLGYPLYGLVLLGAITLMRRATHAVDPALLPVPADEDED